MAREIIARSEHFFITEQPHHCSDYCDHDEIERPIDFTGRCGLWGVWDDDDGDEVRARCIVKVAEHIDNLHASADLFWTNDYVRPTCDECSELLELDETGKCHDGKIRCVTCVEAMYRENGGQ